MSQKQLLQLVENYIADIVMSDELCGHQLPNDINIPPGNHSEVRIQFTSDKSEQFDGFAVEVIFGTLVTTSTGRHVNKATFLTFRFALFYKKFHPLKQLEFLKNSPHTRFT